MSSITVLQTKDPFTSFVKSFDSGPKFKQDSVLYTSQEDFPYNILTINDYKDITSSMEFNPIPEKFNVPWKYRPISSSCQSACLEASDEDHNDKKWNWWKGRTCYVLHVKKGTRAIAINIGENLKAKQGDYSEVVFPPGTIYENGGTTTLRTKRGIDVNCPIINVSSGKKDINLEFFDFFDRYSHDKNSLLRLMDYSINQNMKRITEASIENGKFNLDTSDPACKNLVSSSKEHMIKLLKEDKYVLVSLLYYVLGGSEQYKVGFISNYDSIITGGCYYRLMQGAVKGMKQRKF